jgi:hypothetical protein
MFSKLLFFVQGYSGAANANIDADDHELGGRSAGFAETGKDVQYGDIYDRTPPPSKIYCLPSCRAPASHLLLFVAAACQHSSN